MLGQKNMEAHANKSFSERANKFDGDFTWRTVCADA